MQTELTIVTWVSCSLNSVEGEWVDGPCVQFRSWTSNENMHYFRNFIACVLFSLYVYCVLRNT